MCSIAAEKVPNSQRIQVLQGEVASMRGQAPGIICNLMDKERQLLTQNLVSAILISFEKFHSFLSTERFRFYDGEEEPKHQCEGR